MSCSLVVFEHLSRIKLFGTGGQRKDVFFGQVGKMLVHICNSVNTSLLKGSNINLERLVESFCPSVRPSMLL
jgi:hypothetical protein